MATYDYTKLLFDAVKTRLEADIGSGGLFAPDAYLTTGIFNEFDPNIVNHPWIQFAIVSAPELPVFNTSIVDCRFQLAVYDQQANGLESLSKIMQRIRGPGTIAPSYGLHRHPLSVEVGTGWTFSDCIIVDDRPNSNPAEQIYGRVQVYRVICQLNS